MGKARPPAEEPVHDVLAAEMFAMPGVDRMLHHHGPMRLPDDPTGIAEPHDVLAAEEFPMPAPAPGEADMLFGASGSTARVVLALALTVALAMLLRRRLQRGSAPA